MDTTVLIQISEALARIVARVAPALVAVRIAPDRQQPGLLWQGDLVLTAEAGLPPEDACSLVRPGGEMVPGRVTLRDAVSGIAAIRLAAPAAAPAFVFATPPEPGALAVLLGTTARAEPTVRLAMVHAATGGAAPRLVLDTPLDAAAAGGPVLDAAGNLLGLAIPGPQGLGDVVLHAALTVLLGGAPAPIAAPLAPDPPLHEAATAGPVPDAAGNLAGPTVPGPEGLAGGVPRAAVAAPPAPDPAPTTARRGWLGLLLQPVSVAGGLGWFASAKGRRVVAVEPDSPSARAGIAVGDTLLAIDGRPINGRYSLRELLTAERIGQTIELRLARNDRVETRRLTVVAHPEG